MSSQSPRSKSSPSSELNIETDEDVPPVTAQQIVEWFRALPPDQTMDFFLTLPQKNQDQIKKWARKWARLWADGHEKTKANSWRMVVNPAGHRYWQNYQTRETHWASAMTGGSGALDACTGSPYHVPLD